nr:MAG TPA: hypothetical protein [Caudoviricetes sp.]
MLLMRNASTKVRAIASGFSRRGPRKMRSIFRGRGFSIMLKSC